LRPPCPTLLPYTTLFRSFSGRRGEIQPAAVEVDRMDEVLLVAEAAGRVLHPLDLGVDGFASRVGDAVLEVSDDVGEAAFEHAGQDRKSTRLNSSNGSISY